MEGKEEEDKPSSRQPEIQTSISIDMSELTANTEAFPPTTVSAVVEGTTTITTGSSPTATSGGAAEASSSDDPPSSSNREERETEKSRKPIIESEKAEEEDTNQVVGPAQGTAPAEVSPPQSSTTQPRRGSATRGGDKQPVPAPPRIPRSSSKKSLNEDGSARREASPSRIPRRSSKKNLNDDGSARHEAGPSRIPRRSSKKNLNEDGSARHEAIPSPTPPESPYKVARPVVTAPSDHIHKFNDDEESLGGDSPTQSQVSASSRKSHGRMSLLAPVRPSKFATRPSHVNIKRTSDIDNSLIGVVEGRAPRSEREKQYHMSSPEVSDVGVEKLDKKNKSALLKAKGVLTLLLKLGVVAGFIAFGIFIFVNYSEGSTTAYSEASTASTAEATKSGLRSNPSSSSSNKKDFITSTTQDLNTARTGEEPEHILTSDGATDDGVTESDWDEHLSSPVSHHHPTLKPIRNVPVLDKLKSIILRHQVSLPETLENTTSPQMSALIWLAHSDSYKAAEDDRDVQYIKLLQRFALGVFFYSLGGGHQHQLPRVEGLGLEREIHIFSRGEEDGWRHKSKWMSHGSVCGWFGVTCDDDHLVVSLNLTKNRMRGSIPILELFQTLRETLRSFDVSHNTIKGSLALPPEIRTRAWLKLEHFIVNDNEITGPAPFDWFVVSSTSPLLGINMARNRLSGLTHSGISNLEALKELYLSYNVLVGSLPRMTNLPSLRILHLNDNAFRGTIPEELFQLTSLVEIRAGNNDLSGVVPIDLPLLHDLEILSLEHNNIQGNIPDHFISISNLRYLNLSHNELSGPLPNTLAKSEHIEKISLEHNNLSGIFPKSYSALTKLQCLLLDHNDIYGSIPKEFCSLKAGFFHLNTLKRVEMDCRYEISCDCCDKCH